MMKLKLLLCTLQLIFVFALAQEDFKITVEKAEIISYNKDYISDPTISVFNYNETHQGINCSGNLLQDLGMELKDNVEVFIMEGDKANLLTTANDINVCDVLTSGFPELEEMFKFGNFTKCPMEKGFYSMANLVVDQSNIPPSIPRGKFLIDIKSFNGATELIHSKSYMLVEDVPAKATKNK